MQYDHRMQACALFGSVCVPLVFLIAEHVTCSLPAAFLAATLVLTGAPSSSGSLLVHLEQMRHR